MITRVESLGCGVSRVHATGIGFADVAATYSKNDCGWTVMVQHSNVRDSAQLEALVNEFRVMEGMGTAESVA